MCLCVRLFVSALTAEQFSDGQCDSSQTCQWNHMILWNKVKDCVLDFPSICKGN